MNLDNISNNIAIQCDTEEKARILLSALKKCGYNWEYGENVTHWETYEGETCYFVKNNEIMYHARASLKNLSFYHNMHNIVSFDDIVFPMVRHYKIYDAKIEQPQNNEVVLVELDTEMYCFAHYDEKTGKWYPHDRSTPYYNGIPCMATVVSWMYLPKQY